MGRPGRWHDGAMRQPASLIDDLRSRDLVHQTTGEYPLRERLEAGPITVYCGFDPTADSLHVGNLVPLLLLRRFQLAGHVPIALAGGATGMIGDPGGRESERRLLDAETLAANTAAILGQLERLLDFEPGPYQATLVDNRSWTESMGVIDFLRDVGKHMTIQQMLARDAVRSRLDRESGLSFTEFSYMLLQANDYWHLHRQFGCELQVAGSDQWGNIVSGVDLIRRREGAEVHGLVSPLIVRSDGQKFGKSVAGAVYLDARRTSPFEMFQYFFNVPDDDAGALLRRLTLLPLEEIGAAVAESTQRPELRAAQRLLAREVVSLVHGASTAGSVAAAAAVVFGGHPGSLTVVEWDLVAAEVGEVRLPRGSTMLDVMVAAFGESRGRVKKNLGGFGVHTADGFIKASSPDSECPASGPGGRALVRRGRRDVKVVRLTA